MSLLNIGLFSFIIFFLILLFYYSKISAFFETYDKPDSIRKIHKIKVPLLGGIIIFFYIFFFIFLSFLFLDHNLFINFFYFSEIKNFIIFLFTILLVFILGFIDDKLKIKNSNRIIILIIILIPLFLNDKKLLFYNINFNMLDFNLKLTLNNLSLYCTILFITALMITLNIFDGINLQSGIFYIINFAFIITKRQNK
jgi:UDP-GlcNAc:undecaprenyl-phosphate GlcNAc-1-phosphate transferase